MRKVPGGRVGWPRPKTDGSISGPKECLFLGCVHAFWRSFWDTQKQAGVLTGSAQCFRICSSPTSLEQIGLVCCRDDCHHLPGCGQKMRTSTEQGVWMADRGRITVHFRASLPPFWTQLFRKQPSLGSFSESTQALRRFVKGLLTMFG